MTQDPPGREPAGLSTAGRIAALLACIALSIVTAASDAASPRIGFIHSGSAQAAAVTLAGLRQGLRENGYADGTSARVEARYADGHYDRLPGLARELVRLPVDVLVTAFTPATIAAHESTRTIPIVMVGVSDPLAAGLVATLARPGGNVTGTSSMTMELAGKSLELLTEVVPGIRRVAVLWNPTNSVYQTRMLAQTETAARALGIQLQVFEASDGKSIETAFQALAKEGSSALNILTDPVFLAHARRIAELARKARLPTVSGNSDFADAGALITYGPSRHEMARLAGAYVARILRGARPADLPIEQPTKFELVINPATAGHLGLALRPSLLQRADRLVD